MRFNKLVSIATRQRRRMQGVRLTLVRQINSTCDAQESSVIYHLLLFYLHSLLLFLCLRRRHAWGILRMLLAILWLYFFYFYFLFVSLLFSPCSCSVHEASVAALSDAGHYHLFITFYLIFLYSCFIMWSPQQQHAWGVLRTAWFLPLSFINLLIY